MRHGMGPQGGYVFLIVVAVLTAVALVVLAVLLLSKGGRSNVDGATGEQAPGDAVPLKGQILAFLRRRQGLVLQSELADHLNAEQRDIGHVLHRLELDRLIERRWQPKRNDYTVVLSRA